MEEPPPIPESAQDPVAPPPGTSLLARLLNVFAVPGEVFEEVKLSRFRVGNWLVPTLLLVVLGAISVSNFVSQPGFQKKFRESLQKGAEEWVKAGKARPEEVQKELKLYTDPGLLRFMGACAGAVAGVMNALWWAFMVWLLGRVFLKAQFAFPKAMEVAGLALMIGVLGAVVSLLLAADLERVLTAHSQASAGADAAGKGDGPLVLAVIPLFYVWQMAVTGVGLSKLAGVPFLRAVLLVFIFCCLLQSFLILIGAGRLALA